MNSQTVKFNVPVSLIVAVDKNDGIGKDGKMPWSLSEDIKYFAVKTTGTFDNSKINAVVMGRKTWDSIPAKFRPLSRRLNIVFTRNAVAGDDSGAIFVSSLQKCKDVIEKNDVAVESLYVIGGKDIYEMFLPFISRAFITRINYDFSCDTNVKNVISHIDANFVQCPTSSPVYLDKYEYKWETKKRVSILPMTNSEEYQYLDLMKSIIDKGVDRPDRTGVGTKSLFCPPQMRYNLENDTVPLLTTKRVPWKTVIKELLWFLRGETDAKILQKDGVRIWDGNTSREFLDKRGLTDYAEGLIGPGYGHQWRHFNGTWNPDSTDSKKNSNGGVDQIEEVLYLLKTDPFSRRLVVTSWNPAELSRMALPPCHNYFEFFVTPGGKENDQNVKHKLSLHYHMRSNDVFLGAPFNIFSYAVLLRIMAAKANMDAFELVVTLGDAHLYSNHLEQARKQLERTPLRFPTMIMSPDVVDIDFNDIRLEHFIVENYSPHATILAPMAV